MGEYAAAKEKHGGVSQAARALGIPKTTFYNRLKREQGGGSGPARKTTPRQGSLSAEQLLLRHSTEHQIRHAAAELQEGRFIPEPEFIREIGISAGYRHIVERDEFEQYRGRASGGIVYWSHPKSIKEMKAQHVLR